MKSVLGDRKTIFILLTPALLLYTLVILVPVLWSLGFTFVSGDVFFGFRFVGLQNFVRFFNDPQAQEALWFTIRYAVIITILQVLFGYGLALLYVYVLRKSTFLRTLVFFPVVLPTVAVALLFQKLFQSAPTDGIVNEFLIAIGLSGPDWLGSGGTAFFVLIVLDVWRSMGFYGVLLYAGLLDIPEETLESARIDGAHGWSLLRFIIVPLSLPVLLSSVIFSINGTLKVFDSVLALTNGGPGSSTTPLTLLMFRQAFTYSDYGYASTLAFILTLLCLIVTVIIFRSARKDNKA